MAEFTKIAKKTDLSPGEGMVVDYNGEEVALFNADGTFYALENTCPHQGGPLGEGALEGNMVTCPWHAWEFDVCTGASPINPMAKVSTYEVKVEGDDILIAPKE